jgi:MoaA/NifB/PqqE/SkfB family radical SAM enzyme
MKCALTFITKACPRNCLYCDISSSTVSNEELTVGQWIDAFKILKEIGVTFNLILGNESWLLGDRLTHIMSFNEVPFAMYTTAPPKLFDKYHERFFTGPIDNLSCGIDYPLSYLLQKQIKMNDIEKKSLDGWFALIKTRTKYPYVDTQGMITIHRQNYDLLYQTVKELKIFNIFTGLNFIHYNKDGLYDFFPSKKDLQGFLFTSPKHVKNLYKELDRTLKMEGHLIQQPEVFECKPENLKFLLDMEWHCGGIPYGGPTIQADGTLRCCGYRPGKRTPKLSIFDLTSKGALRDWRLAVYDDAMECPGCSWSFPRMYHYWKGRDPKFAEQIFTKHAGKHIPKDKWSSRKVE